MNSDLFWYLAGALVLAAVILSAVGIRGKASFPPSSGALAAVVAVFAALVIGTGAFAIAYAQDEQEHREHELAAEEHEASAEQQGAAPAAQESAGTSEGGQPAGGGGGPEQVLDVTSPADGSLAFEPAGLEASAGLITLAYDNPSPVPHNINIEVEGETIAESETVTAAATEASAELAPGEYLYYCSVPGHREAGMEGDLTID